MKTLQLKFLILFIFLTTFNSCDNAINSDDEPTEDDNQANCIGETDRETYNYKIIDTDYGSKKKILEGNKNDFSKKFIYNNGVFVCTGTFDETEFSGDGKMALYAVNDSFENIWTFPQKPGKFYDVIHTSDNNYVAVGRKGTADLSQIYVVKVTLSGELIWEYTINVTDNKNYGAYASTITEKPGLGYVIAGKQSRNADLFNFGDASFIFLLNETGTQQWVQPLNNSFRPSDIITDDDGNFVVTFNASKDVIVNKIGNNGANLKQNSFGSSKYDGVNHLMQLKDGNYLLTGYTLGNDKDVSVSYGNTDIWVLKLDKSLNLIKEKTFGGFGYQLGEYTVEMKDNTLLLCAESTNDIFPKRFKRSANILRLTNDLCLIEWAEQYFRYDDYSLTDAIWLEKTKEIVTFSYENDRSNAYDTTDDFYHKLIKIKLNTEEFTK